MSRSISIRFTDDVLTLIDSIVEETNSNRSALVRDACLAYAETLGTEDVSYVRISLENSLKLRQIASQLNIDHDKLLNQFMVILFDQIDRNPYPSTDFMTSENLKEKYETIFRETIDSLTPREAKKSSSIMQAFKHFFTYLCNNKIHPETITKDDVKNYFLHRYSIGSAVATLKVNFWPIKNYYLCFKYPEMFFEPAQIDNWVVLWKEEGIPTNLTPKKFETEVNYQSVLTELKDTINSFHPHK